jgi:pilus assembly protein CpaC
MCPRCPPLKGLLVSRLTRFFALGLALLPLAGAAVLPDKVPPEAKLQTLQAPELSPEWPRTVRVVRDHGLVLALPGPVKRVAVGNPLVADFRLIAPNELYVLGKSLGTTNLLLWPQGAAPYSVPLNVYLDQAPLAESLRQALPQEKHIDLAMASNSVVLSGTVANTLSSEAALSLAEAFLRPGGAAPTAVGSNSRVINLLRVRDQQQVMLDVRIAEVSKSVLDKLGLSLQAGGGSDVRWNILSNFLGGGNGAASLLFRGGTTLNLEAEKQDGLVRILAEPTIVALSGQEGSFLVGGKVFIPVTQATGTAGSAVTLQEREYGVGLKFVPTVLDGGRIGLKVATEVSEISKESLTTSSGSGTSALPAFTTRRVATAVQLQDGQSLVIGGLVRNNGATTRNAFPLLADLPVLGALFRSTQFASDLTELVVVVRASLVKATDQPPGLPTDKVLLPSRDEVFWQDRLQGPAPDRSRDVPKLAP